MYNFKIISNTILYIVSVNKHQSVLLTLLTLLLLIYNHHAKC